MSPKCWVWSSGGKEARQKGDVSQPNTIKARRSLRQYNSFVEGLSEEEIEVLTPANIAVSCLIAALALNCFESLTGGKADAWIYAVQIMNLRQENENVMDTLVRTKVELAETQGDVANTICPD